MSLQVIILAAGLGKRMQSKLPKVLHHLAGKSLLQHVINAAHGLKPTAIYVIYGRGGEQVQAQINDPDIIWVEQKQQLGTAHAVAQALPMLKNSSDRVLVLLSDAPLIRMATLEKLLTTTPADSVGLVTVNMPDPTGLGRIIRNNAGKIIGVVEEKDANAEQRAIPEINTGIIVAPAQKLQQWLPQIKNNNAQQEYYLPEIISLAVSEKMEVHSVMATTPEEVQGINDRVQLAQLERHHQQQIAQKLMLHGVTIKDPQRIDVRGELRAENDVTIDIDTLFEGLVIVGSDSVIGPFCHLKNVKLGRNVTIKSHCVLEDAEIADNCIVGPFARIRPGTVLADGVHIGNFVEVKKSKVGKDSKINHLSYVGDAVVGRSVNIGAGTITCNYDGANKHQTTIEDNVFVGSGTELVAPVTLGAGCTIGAGSTITQNAPPNSLTLRRADKQKVIENWQRPQKK